MPFRIRRSIRILPGFRLNLGKRGLSASAGKRGAHVTLGSDGIRTTAGLSGTGLSYTTSIARRRRRRAIYSWMETVIGFAAAALIVWLAIRWLL